jgi:zinc protease
MRLLSRLTLLAAVLLLAGCAAAPQNPRKLQFQPLDFRLPQFEKIELANGIRLYLKEDHEIPLVSVTAMVGAGSIGDPESKTGLGGLFAATLRAGGTASMDPDELEETLDRLAVDLSVSTGTYTTTLGLSLRNEQLERGMAILADILRRPVFAADRLELARKEAIEGVRRQDDDPSSVASRALSRAIYGDHPLGRHATVESLQAVSRSDLQDFHRRYFHPNNLWLAVSGDFDREDLVSLLNRLFGDWPKREFDRQAIPPVEADSGPVVLLAQKDLPQTTILMGHLGIDKSNPDLQAVRVMNYILGGGGFNSRLMREVRSNRGLAYSVYSYFSVGRRLPGLFIAGSETKSESTLEVVELMRRIVREIRETPVSEEELELARQSLVNSFVFAFDDTHGVVTQRMRLDFFGYPPDYLENYRDKVAAVSVAEVQRVADKYLHPDRLKVVLVGDTDSFESDLQSLGVPIEEVRPGEENGERP